MLDVPVELLKRRDAFCDAHNVVIQIELDFVEVGLGKMPGNFDLDRIEAQQSKQFGKDWPDVRRLLEALMQIGIYYDDVHDKNIRVR